MRTGSRSKQSRFLQTVVLLFAGFGICTNSTLAGFDEGLAAYLRYDGATAVAEFRPLAEEGHALSQFYMGLLYHDGSGVPRDYSRALHWWHKAAQQGSFHAENSIGLAYKSAQGVEQNYQEAATWFRKAAESGLAEAQTNLAEAYFSGNGVEEDNPQAAIWFSEAAAQGYPPAQKSLGWMYWGGLGVSRDSIEAFKWFKLAARKGNPDAIKAIEQLMEKVPPELADDLAVVMAEAERRADTWQPRVQPDRGLPVWW